MFGNMHRKRQNRFLQQKLNDCVYIQYNKKLQLRDEEIHRHNSEAPEIPIFFDALVEEDTWLDPENLSDLLHQADEFTCAQANSAMGISSGPVTSGSRQVPSRHSPIDSTMDEFDFDFNCEAGGPASIGYYGVGRPLVDPSNLVMDDLH